MKYLITGAGQIGLALARKLSAMGDEVTVLRRSQDAVPGTRTLSGDVLNSGLLSHELDGVDAVFHCIHAEYRPDVWTRELVPREVAVMDAAADSGIPVVFPESVYAFGHQAEDLREGMEADPCSPLGEVRAKLLQARETHPARTTSVVAGDLVGPTATLAGSLPTALVIDPVRKGRAAWVLGRTDLPHSMTFIDDLADGMIAATGYEESVLHAPSPAPISLRDLGKLIEPGAKVRPFPYWPVGAVGLLSPVVKSLFLQRYLWNRPMVIHPGKLSTDLGAVEWDASRL